jgi:hypothetical protein
LPNVQEQPQDQSSDQTESQQQPRDESDRPAGENPGDKEEQAASSGPMTLDDARMNFPTMVESFVAERSSDGSWPLKQKSTGKTLKLKYESVLPKSIRKIKENRFTGRAVLREVEKDFPVKADFTIDFGGPKWMVVGMRLVSATPPARKARRKAPAPPPAEEKAGDPDDSAQGQKSDLEDENRGDR